MPVARIITLHPERTDALSKELQSQGYSVEVVGPEGTKAAPADLEIDFEIWPEERAVERAAQLAEQLHADVAVAPGLELGGREPVEHPETEAPPFAEPGHLTGPAVELEGVQQEEPAPVEAASERNITDVSVPPAVWMAAAGQTDAPRSEPDDFMRETIHSQQAGSRWTAIRETARQFAEECRQWLELRVAEFRAARQQRLIELEKKNALAQQRAQELEAARQAASARLQELLRERGGEPAAPQASQEAISATATVGQPGEQPLEPGSTWRTRVSLWMGRRHSPQVQAILTGVAAMAALFTLGLALASFRPRPAISNSLDHPNQGVTVQTGGVTLKPSATPPAGNTPRPSPAVRGQGAPAKQPPARKPAPGKRTNLGDDVTLQHFSGKVSRAGTPRNVAGDATIRQAQQAGGKNKPSPGLKHISDLDN